MLGFKLLGFLFVLLGIMVPWVPASAQNLDPVAPGKRISNEAFFFDQMQFYKVLHPGWDWSEIQNWKSNGAYPKGWFEMLAGVRALAAAAGPSPQYLQVSNWLEREIVKTLLAFADELQVKNGEVSIEYQPIRPQTPDGFPTDLQIETWNRELQQLKRTASASNREAAFFLLVEDRLYKVSSHNGSELSKMLSREWGEALPKTVAEYPSGFRPPFAGNDFFVVRGETGTGPRIEFVPGEGGVEAIDWMSDEFMDAFSELKNAMQGRSYWLILPNQKEKRIAPQDADSLLPLLGFCSSTWNGAL